MSDDLANRNANDDLKNKILSSINTTFTGEATSRWITAMKDDAFDSVEEAVTTATTENKLNSSMAAVIDRLFDNFKRYSFEYNRIQETRDTEISCERPASMRTTADYSEGGKPIKYCLGHLASREWGLIVQGEENRILIYITPVDFLLGFKPDTNEFKAYLEIRLMRDSSKSTREFVWSIGGEPLSVDSLPVLARRLFTQLAKVTKGEAEYTEPFAMDMQEQKAALTQAAAATIDRSFEDDNSMLLGQKKPDLSARTFVVSAEAGADAGRAQPPNSVEKPVLSTLANASSQPASAVESREYSQEFSPVDDPLKPAQSTLASIANGEPKTYGAPPPSPVISTNPLSPLNPVNAGIDKMVASAPAAAPAPSFPQTPLQAPTPLTPPPSPLEAAQAQAAEAPPVATQNSAPSATQNPVGNQSQANPFLVETAAAPARVAETPKPVAPENLEKTKLYSPENITSGHSSGTPRDLSKELGEAKTQIATSLRGLFESLDGAIKNLTAVGLEAMHADDIETVGAVMKQTKSLKNLRDSMVTLSKEWQKSNEG